MNGLIETGNQMPIIKVWNNQRVVTFKDIDEVHGLKKGNARQNFTRNKKHFIENDDYYVITRNNPNVTNCHIENINIPPKGITVLTETGYLMIAKSFTDDLSWQVQRQLVNNYFRQKQDEPKIMAHKTSNTKLPPPQTWFSENYLKMYAICEKRDWKMKRLYHEILALCSSKYDLDYAKELYIKERGFPPKYAIDIVTYFTELQEIANGYINHLLVNDWKELGEENNG